MDAEDWVQTALYVGPIALLVYERCRKLGLTPVLPVLGLAAGILLELRR